MAAMRAGAMVGSAGTTRHTVAWMSGTSKSPSSVRLATRFVHASSGVAESEASSEKAAARLPPRDCPRKRVSGPVCSSTACAARGKGVMRAAARTRLTWRQGSAARTSASKPAKNFASEDVSPGVESLSEICCSVAFASAPTAKWRCAVQSLRAEGVV